VVDDTIAGTRLSTIPAIHDQRALFPFFSARWSNPGFAIGVFIVFTRLLHIQLRKGTEASSHCIVLYRSSFKTTSPRIGPGFFLVGEGGWVLVQRLGTPMHFSRAAGLFFCYIISYSALSGPLVGTAWIVDVRMSEESFVYIFSVCFDSWIGSYGKWA